MISLLVGELLSIRIRRRIDEGIMCLWLWLAYWNVLHKFLLNLSFWMTYFASNFIAISGSHCISSVSRKGFIEFRYSKIETWRLWVL